MQNLAELFGFRITCCETLSVTLRNVPMRVFPCLWLISPSLLRWRLSRPALLMLLSIVPTAQQHPPAWTKWQPTRARAETGAFHEMIGLGFGNVVHIKAGLCHRAILWALLSLCRGTTAGFRLP